MSEGIAGLLRATLRTQRRESACSLSVSSNWRFVPNRMPVMPSASSTACARRHGNGFNLREAKGAGGAGGAGEARQPPSTSSTHIVQSRLLPNDLNPRGGKRSLGRCQSHRARARRDLRELVATVAQRRMNVRSPSQPYHRHLPSRNRHVAVMYPHERQISRLRRWGQEEGWANRDRSDRWLAIDRKSVV